MTTKKNNDSGLDVDYYTVTVEKPFKLPEPYKAECSDIIGALDLPFDLGSVMKAIWRYGVFNTTGVSKSNYNPKRDIEKVLSFATIAYNRLVK